MTVYQATETEGTISTFHGKDRSTVYIVKGPSLGRLGLMRSTVFMTSMLVYFIYDLYMVLQCVLFTGVDYSRLQHYHVKVA